MTGRVIEVNGTPRHLSLKRGLAVISESGHELGRIDLDGVLSILITSPGATVTTPLLNECAFRTIPVIICDSKYKPASITVPIAHHSDQTRRIRTQATAKNGVKNKIWQTIIKAKIKNQGEVLIAFGGKAAQPLKRLRLNVKSGDLGNIEAQAAQLYWPSLFGKDFRRDQNGEGVNIMLNYGYTIIRSTMLGSMLSTGINPSLGIHHKNRKNPFCLVDDLMEPYRPLIDQIVKRLQEKTQTSLNADVKACLSAVAASDVSTTGTASPLFLHMLRLNHEYLNALETGSISFNAPVIFSALDVECITSAC